MSSKELIVRDGIYNHGNISNWKLGSCAGLNNELVDVRKLRKFGKVKANFSC